MSASATTGQVQPARPVDPPRRPAGAVYIPPGATPVLTPQDPTAIATFDLLLGGRLVLNRVELVGADLLAHVTLEGEGTAHAWVRARDLVALHTAVGATLDEWRWSGDTSGA